MADFADSAVTPIKLLLVGPAPPPNGGMAMQTEQLGRLLECEGLQVVLLPTNAPYRPAWTAHVPGLRALARLFPYLWSIWRLAGRCDVIHLMANSGWSWHLFSAPVLMLAPLRGCPVIVNYRGGEARPFFERSLRWVRPFMRRAARVVVPSAYLEGVFRDFGMAAEIVPNIIDRAVFSAKDLPGRIPGTDEPFRFVITRNLEPIYGIDTALKALATLRERGGNAMLEVAGSGPQEAELRDMARQLHLEDNVRFLGRLDRQEIVALYTRADAMLNPTTVDNMPNSVLESLACGVPVISSNVGGVPYIVKDGETALLVPVGDVNALAEAMKNLMYDSDLRERLVQQGEASISGYEWQAVAPQWLRTYQFAMGS